MKKRLQANRLVTFISTAAPRESNTAPTDYESKEHVDGKPQSQAGKGSLIAHTVRGFGDLRPFWQKILQQEILIQFRVDWTSTSAIGRGRVKTPPSINSNLK